MFTMKPVIPAKLKIDVFRLEFLTALHEQERAIVKDFNKTTATWKGAKPKFESVISLREGPSVSVEPGGDKEGVQKYVYVDKGTRKHRIKPKKPGGVLAFKSKFSPKTQPRVIGSLPGFVGGETVFAK